MPGEPLLLRGGTPGIVETSFHEICDHGALGELPVVVRIEIAADEPADDFLSGKALLHFHLVGENLTNGFLAGIGDVYFPLGGVAAAVALEMDGVEHDQAAIGMLEGSEGEAPAEVRQVLGRLERFEECGVRLEVRSDATLLRSDLL